MKTRLIILLLLLTGAFSCAPKVACPAYTSQYQASPVR